MTDSSIGGQLPTGGGETEVASSMPATANAATKLRRWLSFPFLILFAVFVGDEQ